jgi:pimeloyl-ACP methyl ester carboxylesterase
MMLPLAKPLHAAGYALLFFDARSHGRSDGDTFASLPRFAEDLAHAVDWLRAQVDVDACRVGVIGHSVGAAAALLLASQRQDLVAAVTLAAFADPAAIMRRWLKARRIPYWPLGAYILYYVQHVIGHRFADIAPLPHHPRGKLPGAARTRHRRRNGTGQRSAGNFRQAP